MKGELGITLRHFHFSFENLRFGGEIVTMPIISFMRAACKIYLQHFVPEAVAGVGSGGRGCCEAE